MRRRRALGFFAVVGTAFVLLGVISCGSFGSADPARTDSSTPDTLTNDGTTPSDAGSDSSEPTDGGFLLDAVALDGALTGGCDGAVACKRLVFVTAGAFQGASLGGNAGADQRCSEAAMASKNPLIQQRTFRAWLSVSAASASGRLVHGSMPYVTLNQTIIANDWSGLTSGVLVNGINIDQNGDPIDGVGVWTGTFVTGEASTANCGGWLANGDGTAGVTGNKNAQWTDNGPLACGNLARIYCIEQ